MTWNSRALEYRRFRLFALFLIGPLALAACGGTSASEDAETGTEADSSDLSDGPIEVTFGTPGTTNGPAQATYTSLPSTLGYYEDEGLDVEQVDYDGASVVAQALEAGKVDMGMMATPALFTLAAQDGGSSLMSIFTNVTSQLTIVAVKPDSDIESAADFDGATVGVISLAHSAVPIIEAMCKDAGCDPSTLTFVEVGQGATAAQALDSGQVQVLGTYDGGAIAIEALGIELRPIESDLLSRGPTSGFGNALTVPKDSLEDPQMREAFVRICRAQAKAALFATVNPEAAVRIAWEVYPESKPAGVPEDEALAQGVAALEARLANMQPVEGVWGLATDQQIEGAMKLQLLSGQLDEPVDIAEVWTPEFLDEINDFDAEAVEQEAKNWTP